jgi:hypothetical protein
MREAQTIPFDQRAPVLSARRTRLVVALALLPVALIYVWRWNSVVGQVGDDAWYVLLAQSLATGQGYQLLNAPLPGILPNYPPVFPLLLALMLRVVPQAAAHLWLLKFVSIAAMAGIGVATYRYSAQVYKLPLHLALASAMAVTLMPSFVFLATSTVMSECVFTLGQLLTVVVIEKAARMEATRHKAWVVGAALAAGTFLTRSMAITLIAAVVIYLLKERRVKAASLFAISTLLLIAPWMIYARLHAPTATQKKLHGGYIIHDYNEQFWMKRGGDAQSGQITLRELPERVQSNLYSITARDLGGMLLPSALRSASESGEEVFALGENAGLGGSNMGQTTETAVISLSLALLALLGFVVVARQRVTVAEILVLCSLALTLIWPWWTFRFVLPLAPFLLHYVLIGCATLAQWAQRLTNRATAQDIWALPRIVLFCVLALYSYDHWGYLKHATQSPEAMPWLSEFHEARATFAWIRRHLPLDAVVAATNPAQLFLFTERKAVTAEDPNENWEQWQRIGVRYLVVLRPHSMTALDDDRARYPLLYGASPQSMRVIDLGPRRGTEDWRLGRK